MSTTRLSLDSEQCIVVLIALRDRMDVVETGMACAFRAIHRDGRDSIWVSILDELTQELRQIFLLQKKLSPGRYPRVSRARQAA